MAPAHGLDIDHRQGQHAADMLVVVIFTRENAADAVDGGVVERLLPGEGQHLLPFGGREKLAVGVEQLQGVPLPRIV